MAVKIDEVIDQLVIEGLSPVMLNEGFKLKNNRLFFRKVNDCKQELVVSFRYIKGTESGYVTVTPNFSYENMEKIVSYLKGEQFKKGWPTAAANIGNLRPQRVFVEWPLTLTTDVITLGKLISEYIKDYALPFWNDYSSIENLIKGYESQDPRLTLNGSGYRWRMVAANYILQRIDLAKDIIKNWSSDEPLNQVLKGALQKISEQVDFGK
jgi:hypothetical protein